ncbi:MAG: hypothetical protein SF029_14270 [bacterium]|nr:hypothetical protein [bacterium]
MPKSRNSQRRLHLLAAAFYALLAVIILHGILFNTNVRIAGFDYFNYNWNFWWIRHALSSGLNVYESDYVFYPIVSNFGYHALTAFWFPVWSIFEPLLGTFAAVNVILFLGCFLNGYVLFVLLRHLGVAPALALVGGAMLQASPLVRYFYYNTHLNLMDWFWPPAHLLLWWQIVASVEAGRWRRALLWAVTQGVGIWGLGLTDLQMPIFTGFLLVPYGLWTLWKSPRRVRLAGYGLVAVGVGFALLWFAGPLPHMLRFQDELMPGPAEDRPGIPFPGGYLRTYPVWWWWDVPTLGANVTLALVVALIAALTAVFIAGRKKLNHRGQSPQPPGPLLPQGEGGEIRSLSPSPLGEGFGVRAHNGIATIPPPRWFWLAVLIPPLILSMGPTITLFGREILMPYRLMHELTDGMFRMPWRLAPLYIIAAAVFVGQTFTPLLPRLGKARPLMIAAVLLLIGLDVRLYESAPLDPRPLETAVLDPAPLDPAPRHYDFYEQIGREQGDPYDDFVLIDAPTGRGTGEALLGSWQGIQFQYYGMIHGKRMVNGFVSRASVDDVWPIVTGDPLLSWLGQRIPLDPAAVEAQLRGMVTDWPLGYIVVHEDFIGRTTPTLQEIYGYFNSLPDLLCPVFFEPGAVVYRSTAHPDGCPNRIPPQVEPGVYQVDIGDRGDERYLGWGWHWPEDIAGLSMRWTGEYPQTRLYLDLPPGDYTVEIAAQAFVEARTLRLLVNDVPLGDVQTVSPDTLQTLTFTLPAEVVGDGQHLTLTLDYDGWLVPSEIGQSADPRRLAVLVDWVRFRR